jgi:hypothetical protein
MLNKIFFRFTIILLLVFPMYVFAEYKVVIKKNGKVIEGELVAEDDTHVTIRSGGARLRYKKDTLDLEKMKELNEGYVAPGDAITLDRPKEGDVKAEDTGSSLADVAQQNRATQGVTKALNLDTDESALKEWISNLDEKNRVIPSAETEMELSKAKKALTFYRSKGSRELSKNDKRIMLEHLVKALEYRYNKDLEAGAAEDQLAALKRKIEDANKQLSALN